MMNIDLLDSVVAQKLAMSLGHFLWQGALIGVLVLVISRVACERSRWQYAASVFALVMMAACLPVNLYWVDVIADASQSNVIELRYRLKDHNGNAVNTDLPFVRAYQGFANATKPEALVEQDGALQLAPGKRLLAYRPATLGEAMLFEVDVPPKNSSKDFQLRRPADWLDKDSGKRLKLEANVYTLELGGRIGLKIKNVGEGDITFRREDIQFVTRHWRIIPPEAEWLHGHTLTRTRSNGEYSSGYSWSNSVQFGTWIPRSNEEIAGDEKTWPKEVAGKMWVQPQVGPAVHPEMLSLEHPSAIIAREDRYRRDGKVFIEFDKPEFMLGENILLHYALKNQGTEPLVISVGSDYRGSPRALRFKVHAFDEDGKQLEDPSPNPWNMGGLGISPEVKPGETYWLSIPLTKYVRFERAGTYRIKVFHDLGWNETPHIPDVTDNSLPKFKTLAPIVETQIKIRQPTLDEAKVVIEDAKKTSSGTQWGQRSPPYGDLSGLNYSVYLPMLHELAKDNELAANAIAGIHTPDATRVLIDLATKGSTNARMLLKSRLPHPYFKSDQKLNENWIRLKRHVEQSWRDEFRQPVMELAWTLLEADEPDPTEERKRDWRLAGSYIVGLGQAADYERFVKAANPIVESLGNVKAEQYQYPSPPTVIDNFIGVGSQLIKAGAKPSANPRTACESMMFMLAIQANADFRPDGWQRLAKGFMRHLMPRVRSTCVSCLPAPIDDEFVKPITDRFGDTSPLVAALALLRVGSAEDVRFLEAAQKTSEKHQDKWVRDAASYAVSQIKKATEPPLID